MDLENIFWLVSSKSRLNLHNPGDKLLSLLLSPQSPLTDKMSVL